MATNELIEYDIFMSIQSIETYTILWLCLFQKSRNIRRNGIINEWEINFDFISFIKDLYRKIRFFHHSNVCLIGPLSSISNFSKRKDKIDILTQASW